jgi:acetoin utilization deacetylase AcuC-like enzyme
MHLFYSPGYVRSAYAFPTTRKSQWIAESLDGDPVAGVGLVEPRPLSAAEIAEVHDRRYVEAVRTGEPRDLAQTQGFMWDPGLWEMVCASNGGVVAAADRALRDGVAGSLSSGLHHARRSNGEGFCTFNGLVLAAKSALRGGASSVLILDLDAHCGGGTHSLIADDPRVWQLDVSVIAFDTYMPTARTTLDVVRSAADYLPTVERRLDELASQAIRFDLCLYNAGMDPDERCSIGGVAGIDKAILRHREDLAFSWCDRMQIPIAFVLAGGYTGTSLTQTELVELHRLTIEVAAYLARAPGSVGG